MDISQIPFIPSSIEYNIDIKDNSDKNKISKYNIILEKINRENSFSNFFFDYNEKKRNKRMNFSMDEHFFNILDEDDREFSYNN